MAKDHVELLVRGSDSEVVKGAVSKLVSFSHELQVESAQGTTEITDGVWVFTATFTSRDRWTDLAHGEQFKVLPAKFLGLLKQDIETSTLLVTFLAIDPEDHEETKGTAFAIRCDLLGEATGDLALKIHCFTPYGMDMRKTTFVLPLEKVLEIRVGDFYPTEHGHEFDAHAIWERSRHGNLVRYEKQYL